MAFFDVRTTKVTLVCEACGHTARRPLLNQPGSRGTHETESEPAFCPRGHGRMKREDGVKEQVFTWVRA